MKRKLLVGLLLLAGVLGLAWGGYTLFGPRPVRVALVNMPSFMVGRMVQSVDRENVELVSEERTDRLSGYDAVLAFGMGLKWTDEDRFRVKSLDEKGIPYLVMMPTSPDNNLNSLDSVHRDRLLAYMLAGGSGNFRSGFNYLRAEVLGRPLRIGEIREPIRFASDLLFVKHDEDRAFTSVADFEAYYKDHGYQPGAPKVALVAGMIGPFNANRDFMDSIIVGLEGSGLNVYPISAGGKRLQFLREIGPDAVLYFPHGRIAAGNSAEAEAWFKEQNSPLIAPILLSAEYEKWMADPKGMFGGILSQSVVTPEIDGAIVPYALVAIEPQADGLKLFKAIPDRLRTFSSMVRRYVDLKRKPNGEKRLAIFYFKGPGQNSLVAQGIEVVPSLYNVLKRLQLEGYDVSGLPGTVDEFRTMLMERAPLFNSYAEGESSSFLSSGYPALVHGDSLERWVRTTLTVGQYDTVRKQYGAAPGEYNVVSVDGAPHLAVTRLTFGNVTLLPQPGAGAGENDFEMVHGSVAVPSYIYMGAYMWARNGFKADAMMHFGTHGSLEFVQGKQVALSSDDYTDRLVYDLPHMYYYTTANVGEGIIAKRRSYAQTVSYLAPPFMTTDLEGAVANIVREAEHYMSHVDGEDLSHAHSDDELALKIKRMVVATGYHRDLKLDSNTSVPFTREDIEMVLDFVYELAAAKIPGGMYVTGVPFAKHKIESSVELLSVDPLAYGLAQMDLSRGLITEKQMRNEAFYTSRYINRANAIIKQVRAKGGSVDRHLPLLGISGKDWELYKAYEATQRQKSQRPSGMMMGMMGGGMPPTGMMGGKAAPAKGEGAKDAHGRAQGGHPGGMPRGGANASAKAGQGAHPSAKGQGAASDYTDAQKQLFEAIGIIEGALGKMDCYERALLESPDKELSGLVNAFRGGYTAPTPGGDYIASPSVLPTGRNLYSIDPERTPTEKAWANGKTLGDALIADYRKRHNDSLPQKVSFTLWSSSYIESEGTTVAEILYMLGVEPVRDRMGRVQDVRLIPIEELGRPRIDVIVQTSGQLRDIAASRLFLIQKAVDLVAKAKGESEDQNFVLSGIREAEATLLQKGVPAEAARGLATARVFGGLNGAYGTGIQPMVEAGDRWSERTQIADVYLNNMGAVYGDPEQWGNFTKGLFEAALKRTDVVVQPRQSNTWGALSLDHVYEFMGGLSLAVERVTGKDPEAYFTDLRNRYRVRTQELKQAIGVESRTTLLNPKYVRELLKDGEAGAADGIAETFVNTYAWNVMKPSVIDNELWNDLYDMYVVDKQNLGVVKFFEEVNPAALQAYTAAMLETIRKGFWKATPEQQAMLAKVHAESVAKAGAGCSGMVCDNQPLREFIGDRLEAQETRSEYNKSIDNVRNVQSVDNAHAQVLKKEEMQQQVRGAEDSSDRIVWIAVGVAALVAVGFMLIRRRMKRAS